jgi:hypothetical protein
MNNEDSLDRRAGGKEHAADDAAVVRRRVAALGRLLAIAQRDTGQSRRCADFLLAWHSGAENGGWDPTDFWSVDEQIADDMLTVLSLIRESAGLYPGDFGGFNRAIEALWKQWRGARR